MNTPYSVKKEVMRKGKKTTETKYERNSDKKKKFMEGFGLKTESDFAKKVSLDKNWSRFVSPTLPSRFLWIWLHFLDIWRTCEHDFNGNIVLTPRVLLDYCECFKVTLTVFERHLIFRMKSWAEDEIYALKEKDRDK